MSNTSSNNANKYLKYSGIGFTLFALLAIAVYGGQKLDAYLGLDQPWFTILFLLLGFGGWVAKLMKDLETDAKD